MRSNLSKKEHGEDNNCGKKKHQQGSAGVL
jgi:hypothetical protein